MYPQPTAEALHFEEEEEEQSANAAGFSRLDGDVGVATAGNDTVVLQRRQQLTDVLIAAAKKRRAEQLAAARRKAAAAARGAGAYYVDVEAELSDDEEGELGGDEGQSGLRPRG